MREAKTIRELWSILFHELCHIICYDYKIYEIYHHDIGPDKKLAKYVRKHGLKIERFVDKMGSTLMKIYLPQIPFDRHYNTDDDTIWYYKWLDKAYPL